MKILIAGDSWGFGAWQTKFDGVFAALNGNHIHRGNVHKGTEFFLSLYKEYSITNISRPGNSNLKIYDSLYEKSLQEPLNSFNYIFIFYTNPFRDICKNFALGRYAFNPKFLHDELGEYLKVKDRSLNYDDYVKINHSLIDKFKNKLESLNYDKSFYIFGGQNKVNADLLKSKKIEVLIPSLREYFYKDFIEPDITYCPSLTCILEKFDLETLEKLNLEKEYYSNLPKIQKEYFYPDGHHLNIKGHKMLSNYLHDFIQSSNF